jgi:flagella basal body P-ring formation protein FlgA
VLAAALLCAAGCAAAGQKTLATPKEAAHAAALAWLQTQAERSGWADAVAQAQVVGDTKPAPACAKSWSAEPLDTRFISRMRFAAQCGDDASSRREVVVRGSLSARVLVATSDVAAGRPLGRNDLALEQRDISATPDATSDLEHAIGQSSRRSLRTGQILQRGWLVLPVLVKRGDAVQIEAGEGAVQVSSAGEALEPGRRDDVVRVRNSATGRTIRARVVDDGVVRALESGPIDQRAR